MEIPLERVGFFLCCLELIFSVGGTPTDREKIGSILKVGHG
jgi:hypothetical protein